MTRLVTCGFETGHIDEAGDGYAIAGASIVTSPAQAIRSGNYALGLVSGDSPDRFWALPGNPNEINFVFSIYFTRVRDSTEDCLRLQEGSTVHLALSPARIGPALYLRRGGTTIATSAVPFALDKLYWCKCHAKIADSGGIFEMWLDGVKIFDFVGDTRNGATGIINAFSFVQGHYNHKFIVDDLKINDTSGTYENGMPGDGGIILLKPDGAGATTQLTPSAASNYQCVDEVPPNTADYVYGSTADQYDTYALENVPSSYNEVILVQPIMYGALSTAGTGAVRAVLRSDGTDYFDAADKPLTTAHAFHRGDVYYRDPADGGVWTPAKVNGLESGPQVK